MFTRREAVLLIECSTLAAAYYSRSNTIILVVLHVEWQISVQHRSRTSSLTINIPHQRGLFKHGRLATCTCSVLITLLTVDETVASFT